MPSLTQFSVCGANDPSIADPSTNSGNKDVSFDRTRSSVADDGEEVAEDESCEDDDEADDSTTRLRFSEYVDILCSSTVILGCVAILTLGDAFGCRTGAGEKA